MEEVKWSGAFIGVIDFFAILLPGFLLVGSVESLNPSPLLFGGLPKGEAAQLIITGVESYVAGHFIFVLSSALDRPLYDRILRPMLDNGKAYARATALKHRYFAGVPTDVDAPMNTFTWAKTIMTLRAPGALAEVQRYEADSKFFRSLTLLMPVLFALQVYGQRFAHDEAVVTTAVTFALSFLAAWRYGERRFKSTQWAYNFMISMFGADDRCPPAASDTQSAP